MGKCVYKFFVFVVCPAPSALRRRKRSSSLHDFTFLVLFLFIFLYSASSVLVPQPTGQVLTTTVSFSSPNQQHQVSDINKKNQSDTTEGFFIMAGRPGPPLSPPHVVVLNLCGCLFTFNSLYRCQIVIISVCIPGLVFVLPVYTPQPFPSLDVHISLPPKLNSSHFIFFPTFTLLFWQTDWELWG